MHFGFRRFQRRDKKNDGQIKSIRQKLAGQSVVLVGLMGAGKTAIGKRLAAKLEIDFVDADTEIELAAGKSIEDIFAEHGEAYFRDGEKRVIARLLKERTQVLATGGGAFINDETRHSILQNALSIWLRADLDTLMQRVSRRSNRPLLQTDDPKAVMQKLIDERYPVYAEAHMVVQSRNVPHDVIVSEIVKELDKYLTAKQNKA